LLICICLCGSCLVAQTASASFEIEKSTVTAEGKNATFVFGTAEVVCEKAADKYEEGTGDQPQMKFTPTYSGCKGFGGAVTVTPTNCHYELGEATENEPLKEGEITGQFKIQAELVKTSSACSLKLSATECEVIISEQPLNGNTEGSNLKEEKGSLEFQFKASNSQIKYTHKGTCSGIGTGSDGVYKGSFVMVGGRSASMFRTMANIAAAESAATTHTFTFEREEVTCTETKYAYGPITRGSLATLTVKPIIMQPNNLCKTRNTGNGTVGTATIKVVVGNTCTFVFRIGSRISPPRNRYLYKGALEIAGTGCEIAFQGSSAGNEMCKRKVASTQAGLTGQLEKVTGALKIEPNTAFTWSTENGGTCGEVEANGNHASLGNYKGQSSIGGGLRIG
jgi:hypothetical protein